MNTTKTNTYKKTVLALRKMAADTKDREATMEETAKHYTALQSKRELGIPKKLLNDGRLKTLVAMMEEKKQYTGQIYTVEVYEMLANLYGMTYAEFQDFRNSAIRDKKILKSLYIG